MKNNILYKLKSKVSLQISGKHINRFITRLNNNNIDILNCVHICDDTIRITVYAKDYEKIKSIKTVYDVEFFSDHGLIKIKKKFFFNKNLIIGFVLGYLFFLFLTNIIYSVDIVYNDLSVRNFLKDELASYGIKEKTFKKSYKQISAIKEDFLNKYRDKIEWIEIETVGCKYVVRVELRKFNNDNEVVSNRHIVAKKNAVLKDIRAFSGQIVKKVNDYVLSGDVVISGNIGDLDGVKDRVAAKGQIYGEVWYEVNVTYPFAYSELLETSNRKKVYVLSVLNKEIEFFNFNPYKDKKVLEKVLLKNNVFPLKLSLQEQSEVIKKEQILTVDEATSKAIDLASKKLLAGMTDLEYIVKCSVINTKIRENELELKLFFVVYEDITSYKSIENDELRVE